MECGQSPEVDPRVEPHIGSHRARAGGQGHVFVIGPVGRRPAGQELRARRQILGAVIGVVVVDLVVIPDRDPGKGGVGRLQTEIGSVQRVAVPIIAETYGLRTGVCADRVFSPGTS
jgi:hypothetical protein